MLVKINDFRTLKLYQKSVDFTCETLDWIDSNSKKFSKVDMIRLRRKAMTIPTKIARANVDIHIKDRYKKLNIAKEAMQSLILELKPHIAEEESAKVIDALSIELSKFAKWIFRDVK